MRAMNWCALTVGLGLALAAVQADAQGTREPGARIDAPGAGVTSRPEVRGTREPGARVTTSDTTTAAPVRAGTIEVKDLRFGSRDAEQLAIGRAVFTGFARENGMVVADRLTIEDVTGRLATQSWRIPRLAFDRVRLPEELYRALAEGAATTRPWADLFREVVAETATIDTITMSDKTLATEQVLGGFVMTRLARGIVGEARLASITMTAAPDPKQPVRLTTGAIRYRDLDLGESLRMFTGGGDGTPKRVMTSAVLERLEITAPDATVRLGTYEIGATTLAVPADPLPVEVFALGATMQSGGDPDPAILAKVVRWYRGVLRGLKVESVTLRDIAVNGPDADLRVGGVTLAGLVPSGFDLFELRDVTVKTPDGPARLARFAIERVSFAALLDLALDAAESGRDPDIDPAKILDLVPRIGAVRFAGLDAKTPEGPVSLGGFDIEMDWTARLPDRLAVAVSRLAVPIDPSGPEDGRDQLARLGYRVLRGDLAARLRLLAADKALVLDDTTVAVDDVGRIEATLRLDGVDVDAALADPDRADEILERDARLGRASLTLTDLGFAERFVADLARRTGAAPQALRDELATKTRAEMAEALGDAVTPAALDRLADFLRRPGRIAVTVTPRPGQTVRLGELNAGGADLLGRLRIEIDTAPR